MADPAGVDRGRVPEGLVDVVLSYCHNTLNDRTLVPLLPYFKSKGVGVISASFSSMGMFTKQARLCMTWWQPCLVSFVLWACFCVLCPWQYFGSTVPLACQALAEQCAHISACALRGAVMQHNPPTAL